MGYDYLKEYNEYLDRIVKRKTEISAELSKVDLAEQDILHYLEFEKCDAVTMVKITKKLKTLRAERRLIKNELEEITKVHTRIGGKQLKATENKTYTYKTSVMKELIG